MDVMLSAIADRDEEGNTVRSQAVLTNVTEQLAAERAAQAAAAQAETIRLQREMLRAISTPLVPLGDGVLLMPLVGSVDQARAEQMMSTLLDGVVTHAAEVAILDVTGVPSVDASVAEALASVTKAVGLLGARVVLTGLGPSAARALVELNLELGGITTKGTLRDGIAAARKITRR
jgi:rsbT co-antagonist protein RsbR